jgi:hypothetical protein
VTGRGERVGKRPEPLLGASAGDETGQGLVFDGSQARERAAEHHAIRQDRMVVELHIRPYQVLPGQVVD